ncbi:MAG: PTS sugar transporter subunit IIA [Planctomycetota bacterium]
MRLPRYLKAEWIDLDLPTRPDPEVEEWTPRLVQKLKEQTISDLVDMLEASGKIGNPTKLKNEMSLRERKAPTAIGQSIAIPHVRSMQAKEMVIGFARCAVGLPWDAPDEVPVRIFIPLVAPPYDDKLYLLVYQRLAEVLLEDWTIDALLEVEEPGEVIRILSSQMG